MHDQLKPCPFCGGSATVSDDAPFQVECGACGCRTGMGCVSAAGAAHDWNSRPAPAVQVPERRVLAQIIDALPMRRDWLDPTLEREAKALLLAPAPVATEAMAQGYWQATDGGPNPNYQPDADEPVAQGVVANAPCGGVDVEKVMALVQEFGAVMNHIGAGIGEGHDRDCAVVLAEIRALLASPAVPVVDGWMPIETAPKDGRKILAFRPTAPAYGDEQIVICRTTAAKNFAWDGGENYTDRANTATHWQPLPPPPAIANQGEE